MIIRKQFEPSRDDAVRLKRQERDGIIRFCFASSLLDSVEEDLGKRVESIENGKERLRKITEGTDELLRDVRLTIPMDQRRSLDNVASDYQLRIVPSATPAETSVVLHKEEFRTLVDASRARCRDCVWDDTECEEKCDLYKLLVCILPLDEYHSLHVCPYSLGEWKN